MAKTSARPKQELDRATRARLEALMGLDPTALTDGDRTFLKARIDYLTPDERADYLDGVEVNDDETEADKYEAMERADLVAELEARDLKKTGKVAELRARLRENDAEPAEVTE